jgi:hypothetical protein
MRVVIIFMLLLLGCSDPAPGPLEGAWKSDRDLTLDAFRAGQSWTPEQWQKLSSPDLFGHLLYVFHRDSVITVFDGECSAPSSFEMDSASTQIRLSGTDSDGHTATLTLEGGRLYVPVLLLRGGLRETFTRTDLAPVVRRHACVGEFLAGSQEVAQQGARS